MYMIIHNERVRMCTLYLRPIMLKCSHSPSYHKKEEDKEDKEISPSSWACVELNDTITRKCERLYSFSYHSYTLLEKSATWNPFCPVFRTLGEKGSQKGSLHVQEPKKVPYITKSGSKEPIKVLKIGLKTHSEPFREPLQVPPVGQPNNLFFSESVHTQIHNWFVMHEYKTSIGKTNS